MTNSNTIMHMARCSYIFKVGASTQKQLATFDSMNSLYIRTPLKPLNNYVYIS